MSPVSAPGPNFEYPAKYCCGKPVTFLFMARWGMDAAEAQAYIRHMRSSPPGRANQGTRRKVFTAALEQSEQLLAAGQSIAPAASPIPLFYSLSQAGRAIAAAFGDENDWEIFGHGLGFSLNDGGEIGSGLIKPDKRESGAFHVVSRASGSQPLTSGVSLAEAWASVPWMWDPDALGAGHTRPVRLVAETTGERFVARLDGEMADGLDENNRETELKKRLADHAHTESLEVPGNQAIAMSGSGQRLAIAYVAWRDDKGERIPISDVAPPLVHGGAFILRPLLGENRDGISSLMAWWVVLFALSSIARYYPAQWVQALDPNESRSAVPIEEALKEWISNGPQVLLNVLQSLSTNS